MQRINIDLVETNNKEESNSLKNVALKQSDAFFFFGCFFYFFSVVSLKWESHFSTGEEGDSKATAWRDK